MKKWLGLNIVVISLFTYLIGAAVAEALIDDSVVTPLPAPSSGSSTLEVRPAQGEPKPVDSYRLQGTPTTRQQNAGGDLQNAQGGDSLQPNAKTDALTDEN